MSILDKFLSFMKLDDEEEYEDDLFGEEEEFEERKPPKKPFKKPRKFLFGDDDDDEIEEEPFVDRNNVTPIRPPVRRGAGMEVCVIKPIKVDDAREISETLLSGRTVILNLEGLDLEIAQRIIDFTSGATFAINGNLQKISNYIFLVTPTNVDISGDLQDLLNTSFDVPSIRTSY